MKHYNLKPIRLVLRPSLQLAAVLAFAGIGASAAIAALPMPAWQRLGLVAIVSAMCLYHIARDACLRMPRSIIALEVTSEGTCRCQSRAGDWLDVEVHGNSFVTPWLTVLNLVEPGKRGARQAILLSDSGDPDMFRQLRVWLRWGSQVLPD
jgi:toxin CptA